MRALGESRGGVRRVPGGQSDRRDDFSLVENGDRARWLAGSWSVSGNGCSECHGLSDPCRISGGRERRGGGIRVNRLAQRRRRASVKVGVATICSCDRMRTEGQNRGGENGPAGSIGEASAPGPRPTMVIQKWLLCNALPDVR